MSNDGKGAGVNSETLEELRAHGFKYDVDTDDGDLRIKVWKGLGVGRPIPDVILILDPEQVMNFVGTVSAKAAQATREYLDEIDDYVDDQKTVISDTQEMFKDVITKAAPEMKRQLMNDIGVTLDDTFGEYYRFRYPQGIGRKDPVDYLRGADNYEPSQPLDEKGSKKMRQLLITDWYSRLEEEQKGREDPPILTR